MDNTLKIQAIKELRLQRAVSIADAKQAIEGYYAAHPRADFGEMLAALVPQFPPHPLSADALRAENARLRDALEKSYGAINGHGIIGLMDRAADVLELHAVGNARSVLAEDLRAAVADLSRAMGVHCARCDASAALIPVKCDEAGAAIDVCKPCARQIWAGRP